METPIKDLIEEQESEPSAEFEHQRAQQMQMPVQGLPQGPSKMSSIKEFMGQKLDLISSLLVFLIMLLSFFFGPLITKFQYFGAEGKLNTLGMVVVSIIGALVFLLLKFIKTTFEK